MATEKKRERKEKKDKKQRKRDRKAGDAAESGDKSAIRAERSGKPEKSEAKRRRGASIDSATRREDEELDRILADDGAQSGTTPATEAGIGASPGTRTADGVSFELSAKRRVAVRTWRGSVLVDIREFYDDKATGESKPGRKGISLTWAQWAALKALIPHVDSAARSLK